MNRKKSDLESILSTLNTLANPKNVAGMARYGIRPEHPLGISIYNLREIAKGICDHDLALALWKTGIHEARHLAAMVDDPALVTREQTEAWVKDFSSWDLCDQVCDNLFWRTSVAHDLAKEWPLREEEYVRRAGFVMMVMLAVFDKKLPDPIFLEFLALIRKYANDDRNYVKKAINWALRRIGQRNAVLFQESVKVALELESSDSRSARWIGRDARLKLEKKRNIIKG